MTEVTEDTIRLGRSQATIEVHSRRRGYTMLVELKNEFRQLVSKIEETLLPLAEKHRTLLRQVSTDVRNRFVTIELAFHPSDTDADNKLQQVIALVKDTILTTYAELMKPKKAKASA